MNIFDDSKKTIISKPITIGDDDPVIKYRAESDGRTFWAYNSMEVFYDDERMYAALDHIAALQKQVQEYQEQEKQWTKQYHEIGEQVAELKNVLEIFEGDIEPHQVALRRMVTKALKK